MEKIICIRIIALIVLISSNAVSYGQENPWKPKKTENPWIKKTEEGKKEKAKTIDTTTVIKEQNVADIEEKKGEIKIVRYEKSEIMNLYQIEQSANAKYNGSVGLAVSALTMAIPAVNIIALPVNIASIFIKTPQQAAIINEFQNNYPDATKEEIKAVRKGIRKKRAKRTGAGMAIGTGIFAILMLTL